MAYKIRTRDEHLLNDGSPKLSRKLSPCCATATAARRISDCITTSMCAGKLLVVSVGTGSRDPKMAPANLAMENALKALISVMDDCADLMEILLQWMSSSHTARVIDREMGDLRHDSLATAPLINYLRYNIALTKESLTPLGIDLPDAKFESLSAMDDPANMPTLQDVGARAAKQQVRGEDFPSNFDLTN